MASCKKCTLIHVEPVLSSYQTLELIPGREVDCTETCTKNCKESALGHNTSRRLSWLTHGDTNRNNVPANYGVT